MEVNVIKIGGNVIDNDDLLDAFLSKLKDIKTPVVLIHGGGKIATKIGEQMGIQSHYVNGRRITDAPTRDLVAMVYGGLINKKIVAHLQRNGLNAIGLTGVDANLLPAHKRPIKDIDYGWVGDIVINQVNNLFLQSLLQQNIIPVIAPLTHDMQGNILNTNADDIASAIAISLAKLYTTQLIFCFEKKGILLDVNNDASALKNVTPSLFQQLLTQNKLSGGVIPKLENAFKTIDKGIDVVVIGHSDDIVENINKTTCLGTWIEK